MTQEENRRIKRAAWMLKNKEKQKAYFRKRYLDNKEAILKDCRDRYERNKEAIKQKSREYYLKNRAAKIAYAKLHRTPNEKKTYYTNLYRARKRRALSQSANPKIIKMFYLMAARVSKCIGVRYSVDHIIPVSKGGQHHQDNLQILPLLVNIRKHAYMPT